MLGGLVVGLLLIGVVTVGRLAWAWASGDTFDGIAPTWSILLYFTLAGSCCSS